MAALIRAVGDWDVAEDAVQDAFATAAQRWPAEGVPRDPLAWIVAVIAAAIAYRRAGAPLLATLLLALSFMVVSHPPPIGPISSRT